ncbi:MAG: signal recognition particle receptor subunit alpha, partial [Bdellovibrio sp.]
MFDQLTNRFTGALKKIRGQHRISEQNIEETLKEVRLALLEADVHFKVAKSFLEEVRQKALGAEVLKGLDPGQQFIQILHDELVSALGSEAVPLDCRKSPSVIFLVGLQGVGKTTTAAKLALYVRQKLKKKPGLVPADLARPAAIDQLTQLAKTNNLPVFPTPSGITPTDLMSKARDWAREQMVEVLIVDTAGRSQVDEPLMVELQSMREILPAHEVLLVADAMLGQQSVQVAEGFHQKIPLTGLILTKVDGDARGGAALSVRKAVGVPIKF